MAWRIRPVKSGFVVEAYDRVSNWWVGLGFGAPTFHHSETVAMQFALSQGLLPKDRVKPSDEPQRT